MVKYATLPIITEVEGVEYQLQQNLSDLIYAVFYSDNSDLIKAFRNGYVGESLNAACSTAITGAIGKLEQQKTYVIKCVNLLAMNELDDTLEIDIEVISETGAVQKTITLDKATI